ncbi:MAG TPA: FMN-binding protein [Gemmatimonadaceae bacterium]|nr:FMN-binding protein [Gemmatimonadaceae bacterium]
MSGGVLALGSAVVLAVYGAGYFRTREAAARFADDAVRRPERPAPVAPRDSLETVVRRGTDARPAPRAATGPTSDRRAAAPRRAAPPAAETVAATTPAATAAAGTPAAIAAAPPPVQATPAPVEPAAPAAPGAPAAPAGPAPVAAPIPAPAPAADTAHTLGLHDGTYTGWGTSRHGDIEATVVIKDGAIASATISRCLTRYSCSWISHLQAQVVKRQSPEVDYVSGATQSTNAFYYAVVEALAKAK